MQDSQPVTSLNPPLSTPLPRCPPLLHALQTPGVTLASLDSLPGSTSGGSSDVQEGTDAPPASKGSNSGGGFFSALRNAFDLDFGGEEEGGRRCAHCRERCSQFIVLQRSTLMGCCTSNTHSSIEACHLHYHCTTPLIKCLASCCSPPSILLSCLSAWLPAHLPAGLPAS